MRPPTKYYGASASSIGLDDELQWPGFEGYPFVGPKQPMTQADLDNVELAVKFDAVILRLPDNIDEYVFVKDRTEDNIWVLKKEIFREDPNDPGAWYVFLSWVKPYAISRQRPRHWY